MVDFTYNMNLENAWPDILARRGVSPVSYHSSLIQLLRNEFESC